MAESQGNQERASEQGPFTAAVSCGPYQIEGSLTSLEQREVTTFAFRALEALVDSPDSDADDLGGFMTVAVLQTGQLWIFGIEVFLQNLLHRKGDQSKVRRALERLAPQEPEEESADS